MASAVRRPGSLSTTLTPASHKSTCDVAKLGCSSDAAPTRRLALGCSKVMQGGLVCSLVGVLSSLTMSRGIS